MNDKDLEKIESMIARHIGVYAESVNHKFDILVEGHQMLSEQMHRFKADVDRRFSCVEYKLDVTAAKGDLTASKLDKVNERLDEVALRGDATVAKLDAVAAKLDEVALRGDATAAKLDAVAAKLDEVALRGDATAAKLDEVALRGDATAAKLDGVAADLKAHRADTEAHRHIYGVKEP
ncbi:MAG: hypothetical protein M0Q23_00040 [Syntrophales bacterium]|jgi:hypothetical protein|nr:hypothetical protein [Syntrophales bacterium]MCK9527039.1 hypothetical protein [Syntrophales bacterium]MDX9921836.1 hypothetical protein [Syntrophales bacterium]